MLAVSPVPGPDLGTARVFATGQGRKTDPVDARSVAVTALRAKGLRQVNAATSSARPVPSYSTGSTSCCPLMARSLAGWHHASHVIDPRRCVPNPSPRADHRPGHRQVVVLAGLAVVP